MGKPGAEWSSHLCKATLLIRNGAQIGSRQSGLGAPMFSPTLQTLLLQF